MEKKELLDLIDQDSSFMKAFLDEYRQDGVNFGAEDRLMSLFVDMKQSVVEDQIPESLFDRLANLIRTLEVEKLRTHQNELQKLHNFEKYRDLAENVFVNSFFVSKTFYLLKAIGFTSSNVVLIGANGSGKTTFANSIRVSSKVGPFLGRLNSHISKDAYKLKVEELKTDVLGRAGGHMPITVTDNEIV